MFDCCTRRRLPRHVSKAYACLEIVERLLLQARRERGPPCCCRRATAACKLRSSVHVLLQMPTASGRVRWCSSLLAAEGLHSSARCQVDALAAVATPAPTRVCFRPVSPARGAHGTADPVAASRAPASAPASSCAQHISHGPQRNEGTTSSNVPPYARAPSTVRNPPLGPPMNNSLDLGSKCCPRVELKVSPHPLAPARSQQPPALPPRRSQPVTPQAKFGGPPQAGRPVRIAGNADVGSAVLTRGLRFDAPCPAAQPQRH